MTKRFAYGINRGYFHMKNTVNQLKIAMIGAKGAPAIFGGIERSVDELGSRLAEMGHSVTVYCRSWYTRIKKRTYKGMRLQMVPTMHTKHLDAITHTFFATIHAMWQGFDVYHFHGVGPSLLSFLPRIFRPGATVIVSFQSIDREHAKWGWFARMMLHLGEWVSVKAAHEVLASSHMIRTYIKKSYNETATYLPNGASQPWPAVPAVERALIAPWNIEPKKYIVVVTRLIAHKAVHEAIDAFIIAKSLSLDPRMQGMQLVIVGDGSYTEKYVAELHERARGHEDIIFTGYQSGLALAALMRNAYVGVHASHAEGLPMSVLELMVYGVPVIVSDIIPHREAMGDLSWQYPVGAKGVLAERIMRAVTDPAWVAMGSSYSRQRIALRYDWDTLAQSLSKRYTALAGMAVQDLKKHSISAQTSKISG